MIFGVAELISFCSHSFTLEPGDLILTGTPWGVGEFMDPKRSLQDGDVVECEIEGIGVLRNPVVDVDAGPPPRVGRGGGRAARLGRRDGRRNARDAAPRADRVDHQPAPCRLSRASRRARGSGSARRRRWPRSAGGSVPAVRDRVDRLADDPQPGDGRRQPVRAPAARRPRGLPARARRERGARGRSAHRRLLQGAGALVLHQGDAAQAELGVDRHGGVRWRADRPRRRRAASRCARYAAEEALASGDIDAAAQLAVEAADPFDDAFASAWYRRRVLPVHVRRALANAV